MKKYELVKEDTKNCWSATLYRVRYLSDFADIRAGDLGGYIEKEDNLLQDYNSRVRGNAIVAGNSRVDGNAIVTGNARVDGFAVVGNTAQVYDDAEVTGKAIVGGYALIRGNAIVRGNATVKGKARIGGNSQVTGNARIDGEAIVRGNARVDGNAIVTCNVTVEGNARVDDDSICEKLDPINLAGLTYNVTITDNNIHIGCKTFKLEQALKLASKWKSTKLRYEEAEKIEEEKKIIVDAIKYRLQQLAQIKGE